MGVYNASNVRQTKAGLPVTAYVDPDPQFVVNQQLTRVRVYPGEELTDLSEGSERQILADAGDIVRQSQIDSWFPPATVTSLTPTTGTAAGGTVVTINGTNLDGVTAVTFGGTAGTALTYVNNDQIRVTTPAHTAGLVTVVLTDDSGTVTDTGAFTFV